MRKLIICYCILLLSCSRKSHVEQKSLSAPQSQNIRVDGIYYGTSRNYNAKSKQYKLHYPYLKFYTNGYVLTGIAEDSATIVSIVTIVEDSYKPIDTTNNGGRFSITDNFIYIEQIYSGMKQAHNYLVYRIRDQETLEWVGSTRKMGKLQQTIPEPIVFHFRN